MLSEDDLEKIGNLVKTHIGVMAEDFQHRLGVVADGVMALDEKLDRNTSELKGEIEMSRLEYRGLFASLDEKIDGVKQGLDEKIDGVEQRLEKKIDGVEQHLEKKIDTVRDKLTGEIRAVGDKVEGHEERIQILERKVA